MKLTLLLLVLSTIAEAKWPKGAVPFARAVLAPRGGSSAQGTVDFAMSGKNLLVRVSANKLSPGLHGIHVHEKGDCSAADAASAGDHFNPTEQKHGGPRSKARHAGDLGNLVANRLGNAELEITIPPPSPTFAWSEFVGKSVVVHERADDLITQPAGNSGGRIACGVVVLEKAISE